MADLSTLDETQPTGSDSVSGGDDAIRATRDATKTSFGGADSGTGTQASEHYLKGFHKFPNGTTAARPAAGNAGRVYLNTEQAWVERDDGSAWRMANAIAPSTGTGGSVTLTGSYQVLATAAVTVPTGGRAVIMAHVYAASTLGGSITVRLRSQATFTLATVAATISGAGSATVPILDLDPTPTPGSVSYTVEALYTGSNMSVTSSAIIVLVC